MMVCSVRIAACIDISLHVVARLLAWKVVEKTTRQMEYPLEQSDEMILGIHHVQLTVPSGAEEEARRFYYRVLGLPEFTYRLASSSDARLRSIRVSAFDPGMMPGTGLAGSYLALLRFIWNYILPAFTLFQRNVHRPAQSGRRLAALVSDGSETTAGKYYSDGREARSSALSYNKLNAAELWDASADMVGLPRSIV